VSRSVSATVSRPAALVAVALAAAALGFGAWRYLDTHRAAPPDIHGYVLTAPRALPAFELVDEHGRPFRPADFVGRWSFLYFGYTYCPDVCPLTLVQVANLKRRLRMRCEGLDDRYYLVSVDPQRDTLQRLGEYVRYFDREFRGVTGAAEEIDKLAEQARVLYELPEDRSRDDYLVGHSSTVTVVDPDGKLHAVFTTPHTGERMADDFAAVHERYRERHADYTATCRL
jgi:protein SCO1/2